MKLIYKLVFATLAFVIPIGIFSLGHLIQSDPYTFYKTEYSINDKPIYYVDSELHYDCLLPEDEMVPVYFDGKYTMFFDDRYIGETVDDCYSTYYVKSSDFHISDGSEFTELVDLNERGSVTITPEQIREAFNSPDMYMVNTQKAVPMSVRSYEYYLARGEFTNIEEAVEIFVHGKDLRDVLEVYWTDISYMLDEQTLEYFDTEYNDGIVSYTITGQVWYYTFNETNTNSCKIGEHIFEFGGCSTE